MRRIVVYLVALAAVAAYAEAAISVSHAFGRASEGVTVSGIQRLSMRLRGGFEIKDKATGITFPGTLQAAGKNLQLMGAGERKKKIVGPVAVNVYAIGLYVDAGAAKGAGGAVTDDKSAAAVLSDGTFAKSLRLVMARTVGAEKIGDALAEQLEPRCKGTDAPVGRFKEFFKSLDKLETNQEVLFTANGSTLSVKAHGKSGDFVSSALCKAMFNIYLGDKPVSDNAKKSFVEGFRKLCGK